jgi:hypothetical protein
VESAQIQQGNTQAIQISVPADREAITAFLQHIKPALAHLNLDSTHLSEANAEIQTLESQLSSPNPKTGSCTRAFVRYAGFWKEPLVMPPEIFLSSQVSSSSFKQYPMLQAVDSAKSIKAFSQPASVPRDRIQGPQHNQGFDSPRPPAAACALGGR